MPEQELEQTSLALQEEALTTDSEIDVTNSQSDDQELTSPNSDSIEVTSPDGNGEFALTGDLTPGTENVKLQTGESLSPMTYEIPSDEIEVQILLVSHHKMMYRFDY